MIQPNVSHTNDRVKPRSVRKQHLVSVRLWALNTGKRWLVKAVMKAIGREGLRHE
jgi:hypothetical protein